MLIRLHFDSDFFRRMTMKAAPKQVACRLIRIAVMGRLGIAANHVLMHHVALRLSHLA